MLVIRLIGESFAFAWKALKSNLLRTVLSLLGVTVGIFAIIAVFTLVDSLEKNIKSSFDFLGTGVIYVGKWPFTADANGEFKWWEYWRRPTPSVNEYKFLNANLKNKSAISIYAARGNSIIRKGSNSIGQVGLRGAGDGYDEIFEVNLDAGRYFTMDEVEDRKSTRLNSSHRL